MEDYSRISVIDKRHLIFLLQGGCAVFLCSILIPDFVRAYCNTHLQVVSDKNSSILSHVCKYRNRIHYESFASFLKDLFSCREKDYTDNDY